LTVACTWTKKYLGGQPNNGDAALLLGASRDRLRNVARIARIDGAPKDKNLSVAIARHLGSQKMKASSPSKNVKWKVSVRDVFLI
jgi:hypothetical protein